MRLYALITLTKFTFVVIIVASICGGTSVYASISATNQCAKLFEFKKQNKSFRDLINEAVRAEQALQNKISKEQQAAEGVRKEEEGNQRVKMLDSIDYIKHARKIKFVKIPPGKFLRGESNNSVEAEITQPFEVMDTTMTQMMYAQLMILMKEQGSRLIFPSFFTDGPNSILYDFNGEYFPMRPDDPVTNLSWNEVYFRFVLNLNGLSQSNDMNVQSALRYFINDHQKDDVYTLITDAQMEYIMKLAKNEIYLFGNLAEFVYDQWDGKSPPMGGQDPISSIGVYKIIRGGSYYRTKNKLSTSLRKKITSTTSRSDIGFRLVRISRSGQQSNSGGTP